MSNEDALIEAQEIVDSFKPYSDKYGEDLDNAQNSAEISIDRVIDMIIKFRRKPQYSITMSMFTDKLFDLQLIKDQIKNTI